MAGNSTADIVFCLDASSSMTPSIEAVRENIARFVDVFRDDPNRQWNVRLDFVAHNAGGGFSARSVYEHDVVRALYGQQGRFFSTDVADFQRALGEVTVDGDEASLVALDCALDFPWRSDPTCRRVVVLLSDEPVESGTMREESIRRIPDLVEKLAALKVTLYLITPDSAGFEAISQADKADWMVVDEAGVEAVDLGRLMTGIAKSISISQAPLGAARPVPPRGLFGQASWR